MNALDFAERRKALADLLPDGTALILFSGQAPVRTNDEKFLFSPNRNFYYATGVARENLIFLLVKQGGAVRQTLFVERPNELAAKWVGAAITGEEATAISGIEDIQFLDEWLSTFGTLMWRSEGRLKIALELDRHGFEEGGSNAEKFAAEVRQKYPAAGIVDASDWFRKLRMIKSPAELEEIRKAIAVTDEALRRMWANARPGMMEYELEAHFDFVVKSHGVRELPYNPIVAGGKNATVLHYQTNNEQIADGALVLLDLGAESNYYAADITRTFPVNGKFSDRQRAFYEIVLDAEEKIIAAVKPGVTLRELNDLTKSLLAEGLIRMGVIEQEEELIKYYFHSIAHHLGLDTHDSALHGAPLEPGMVITIEPGLYIEEEAIGIRIEDDVLVTADGFEVLSPQIPKSVEDMERLIGTDVK